jgi:hypothetical protein
MKIQCEFDENTMEQQKFNTSTHPLEEKNLGLVCCLTLLVATNKIAYLCPLPFLAKANSMSMNYGCIF